MIVAAGLGKSFGRQAAVVDLDLEVPEGSIFGLLGHNGAGKSTAIGIMLGQVFPDRGSVRINGHDVLGARHAALAKVGAIFETPAFYDYLSGWRNLRILSDLTGPTPPGRMEEVVELVGLTDRIGDRVALYSHGMRQRLAIAQALLPEPRLLILDEPSDGLDPEGIREMRELIAHLNRDWGLTVLLSSHLLGEVEQICTHVAVMRHGRLLHSGRWPESGQAAMGRWLALEVDRPDRAMALLRSAGLIEDHAEGRVKLAAEADPADVVERLVRAGHRLHRAAPAAASLEAFYLHLVDCDRRGEAASSSVTAAPEAVNA